MKKVNAPKNLTESTDLLKMIYEDLKNGEINTKTAKLISRASSGQIKSSVANFKRSYQSEKAGAEKLPEGEFYDSELQSIFLSYGEILAQIVNNEVSLVHATEALKLIDKQLSVYELSKGIKGKIPGKGI
jgi:hypothetical protein